MSNENWSKWIEWGGGECPLVDGIEHEIRFRNGDSSDDDNPETWRWTHIGEDKDIIAYRYRIEDAVATPEQEADWHKEEGLNRSDGSTASYYELPPEATELQHLISYRNMNAQDGEMFRALYRKGLASHSDELRDAKKVLFYAKAEVERLEKYRDQN